MSEYKYQTTDTQNASSTGVASKVVPLLQALSRLEDNASSLTMRLDPIVNHVPQDPVTSAEIRTVTQRINSVGDVLQYLLDNIEL